MNKFYPDEKLKAEFIERTCNFLQNLQDNYEVDDLFGFFAEPDILFENLNIEVRSSVELRLSSRYAILQEIARLLKEQFEADILPSYWALNNYLQYFHNRRVEIAEKIFDLYCQEPLFVDGDIDDESNELSCEEGQ